ncbi:MAG: hypothetical protein NTX05_03400, partial [Fusobacteria bacterium]|nr:hypothetical protein [Fusobacteriota bacterium]
MKNKSSVLYLFLLIGALILLYGCHSLSPITQIPTAVTTSSSSTAATIKEKPVTLPSNISNYSKAALLNNITPFIQTGIKSIQNNTPLSKQVLIPKLTANVIQCDYFAYQDYENGKISKKQLLQIIINTQKSITSLTSEFFQVNSIVINYPL